MQLLHVDKIERHIENGCTEPFLAILNTGEEKIHAVIKTKDNIQGILTLINELVCYKLANAIGILMPDSGVATIDDQTIVEENMLTDDGYGSCFYSKYIERASILNENIMDFISNKEAYEEIILFDHLTYNKDRNKGNLLISTGKGAKLLYVIDHSHVFKNATIWDSICFRQGISDNDYLDVDILEANGYGLFFRNKTIIKDSLLKIAEKFKHVITKQLLDDIINSIPSDWKIPNKNLEALKIYLLYRVEHMNEMCEIIADYKEWR